MKNIEFDETIESESILYHSLMNSIPKQLSSLKPGDIVIWISEYYYIKLLKAQSQYDKEAILFSEIRNSYQTQTDLIVSIEESIPNLYDITTVPLNDKLKSIQVFKKCNYDLYAIVL